LFFSKPATLGRKCIGSELWAPVYQLAFEPLTLKPGEAAARVVKVKRAKGEAGDVGEGYKLLAFPFDLPEKQTAELCITIELSTPSVSKHFANVLVMELGAGPGPNMSWGGGGAMPEDPPNVLLKRSGTIFD
jgi:hypothetical protein